MFWKKKQRVAADDLAGGLMVDCLSKPPHVQPLRTDLSPEQRDDFEERALTYQVAAVLLALALEGKKRAEFTSIPKIIIGKLRDVEGGEAAASEAESATHRLGSLITSSSKQYSWAREWYADIGIDESNPAVLAHLATSWLDYINRSVKILQGFRLS